MFVFFFKFQCSSTRVAHLYHYDMITELMVEKNIDKIGRQIVLDLEHLMAKVDYKYNRHQPCLVCKEKYVHHIDGLPCTSDNNKKTIITITGIRPDFIRMSQVFKRLDEDNNIIDESIYEPKKETTKSKPKCGRKKATPQTIKPKASTETSEEVAVESKN